MQQQSPRTLPSSPMSACFHRFHVLAQPPALSRTCNLRRVYAIVRQLGCCPSFAFRSCSLLLLAAREQQCCWSALLRAFRVAYEGRAISIRTRCPTATHTLHALHALLAPPPKYTRRRAPTTRTPTSTRAHTTLHCHAACNQAHAVVWARAQLARHRRLPRGAVAPSGGSCCFSLLEAYSGKNRPDF